MRSQLLLTGVDIAPLLKELQENPQLWDQHDARKLMGVDKPHAEMSDIWVRYNDFSNFDPANPAAFNDKHVPVWYPAWNALHALHPIIRELMATVNGEMLGGVLITRIPAGCKIGPHVDTGWHVGYYSKFYLSLKNAPGATFNFQDEGAPDSTREVVRPKPGELYYIDNRKRHWVENNSTEERITVIICIRTNLYGEYYER